MPDLSYYLEVLFKRFNTRLTKGELEEWNEVVARKRIELETNKAMYSSSDDDSEIEDVRDSFALDYNIAVFD